MGRRRKGRKINGIVLINKPLGGSSNQILQKVRWLFGAEKAGHTGALDPLATGMLPICLGEATKFSQFLLDADKTYEVTAKLGIRTTTSDADGEVVEERPVDVSDRQLEDALDTFRGRSKQVPSMFSALKYQGKPLYTYARQGIDVPREPRDITIFQLDLLRFEGDDVDLRVHCSKGTYIRSLVDDLGQLLGCGAYVTKLHRTLVADYPADKMVELEALEALVEGEGKEAQRDIEALDSHLLPMTTAVGALPELDISAEARLRFGNGNPVAVEVDGTGLARVYEGETKLFLGVGEVDDKGLLAPKRLVVYETD